jgi:hypothetical protein
VGRREEIGSPQSDEIESFTSNQESDEAQVDPGDDGMSVVSLRIDNIAHTQDVELLLAAVAGGIDGEEYRPGDAASNEAHDNQNLEHAKPEVTVKRVVTEDVGVGKGRVVAKQAKEARLGFWRDPSFLKQFVVGSGSVDASVAGSSDEEDNKGDEGNDDGRNQGRNDARERVGALIAVRSLRLRCDEYQ